MTYDGDGDWNVLATGPKFAFIVFTYRVPIDFFVYDTPPSFVSGIILLDESNDFWLSDFYINL